MAPAEPAARALGVAAALGSALAWTLIGLHGRALGPYLNALSINMLRSAAGSVLVLAAAGLSGRLGGLRGLSPAAWAYLVVSVLTAFAVGDTLFFESTRRIGLARGMALSMVYPLVAGALGVGLFGEPISPTTAAGAVVTLGGLALLVAERAPAGGPRGKRAGGDGVGVAMALLAALAWGVSAAIMKPPLREVDPLAAQAVRLPMAAAVLAAMPGVHGSLGPVRAHPRRTLPHLAALAVLTAVSAVTYLAGLKYAGIATATVLSSTAPLFALPIGVAVFGERVERRTLAGTVLCVGGIALLSRGGP